MAQTKTMRMAVCAWAMAAILFSGLDVRADDSAETRQELRRLEQQNQSLQAQLEQQRKLIESLSHKVNEIQEAGAKPNREMDEPAPAGRNFGVAGLGKVNISGEGGVAFFNSGREGMFPNAEFRVDEAKLFVEAPVWGDVYFFTELNLMTREAQDLSLQLGELYLDFENVSRLWHRDGMLSVRAGRMDIPFGEEYINRDAIDNPLISHSLSDFWGVDEGVELYGSMGKFSYVLAVQSGGMSGVRDFTPDKAIAGRISFDPASWLHLSVSGMRTGDLDAVNDIWSKLWFASAWFLPSGSTNATKYHANLVEADLSLRLPHAHIKAFGGYVRYDDNDPFANNSRDIYYYSLEGVHDITRKLYGAVRFSQIFADKGMPINGNGQMDDYIFSGALTEEIWRLTLGLGYRWSQKLLLKTEYAFERGKEVGGEKRNHEDLFALEAAFKF
jgi:hypothetical protein